MSLLWVLAEGSKLMCLGVLGGPEARLYIYFGRMYMNVLTAQRPERCLSAQAKMREGRETGEKKNP
jgi:hypothetical protein